MLYRNSDVDEPAHVVHSSPYSTISKDRFIALDGFTLAETSAI